MLPNLRDTCYSPTATFVSPGRSMRVKLTTASTKDSKNFKLLLEEKENCNATKYSRVKIVNRDNRQNFRILGLTIRRIYAKMNWNTGDLFGATSFSICLILNLFPHSSYTNMIKIIR